MSKGYEWMSLKEVLSYESEMREEKVSVVARSPRGFLTAYKRAGNRGNLSSKWIQKRNAFVARHLVQYRKNPTYRRKLALIAWAYNPD